MNRDNIIKYIRQPGKLDQNTLPEIEELLNAFPYFQTAYLLHVKNHHNIKSLKFNDSLKSASARIGDRSVLYHLIHGLISEKLHDIRQPAESVKEIQGPVEKIIEPGIGTVKEVISPDLQTTDQKEETLIPERSSHTFTGWFDQLDYVEEERSKDKELIDAFIQSQPRIIPGKGELKDQEDISEAFIKPDEQLMTETLAQIYVKQGYYLKAIHVYETLSLKFPEKSSYFAAQINKIKQCIY
jgi:hypothetical protein